MQFYFLKRGFQLLAGWWQAAKGSVPPYERMIKRQYYGRLIDQATSQHRVNLPSPIRSYAVRQPGKQPNNGSKRRTIPRHLPMDLTPQAVLVCAGCGTVLDPNLKQGTPCLNPDCGSNLQLFDFCSCLYLPLDGNGKQNHRFYRRNCEVHDE